MEAPKMYLFYHCYYKGKKTTYVTKTSGQFHSYNNNVTFEVICENGVSENFVICSSFLKVSNSKSKELDKWGRIRTGAVRVKNIQPRIFRDLLQYILKGFQWKSTGSYCDDILLLQAAHLFEYPSLVRLISTTLCSSDAMGNNKSGFLAVRTVCDVFGKVFELGRCRAKEIIWKAEKFIIQNTSSVLKTNGFRRLSAPALQYILTRKNLNLNCELELFHAVLEWARAQIRKQNQCSENISRVLRSTLLGPLRLLQYSRMTRVEIEQVVVPAFRELFKCSAANLGIQLEFTKKGQKAGSSSQRTWIRRNYYSVTGQGTLTGLEWLGKKERKHSWKLPSVKDSTPVTREMCGVGMRRKKARGKGNAFAFRLEGPNRTQNAFSEKHKPVGNMYYMNPAAGAMINRHLQSIVLEKTPTSKRPLVVLPLLQAINAKLGTLE